MLPTLIRPMATGSGLACALDRDARDGNDVFSGDGVFSGDDVFSGDAVFSGDHGAEQWADRERFRVARDFSGFFFSCALFPR